MASIVKYQQDGIAVTINDYLDLVVKVPEITQLFAKAVVQFVTSLAVGSVAQIIVTIGAELNRIEYVKHEQKVVLNIAKLEATTKHYAKAIEDAKQQHYPVDMKQELEAALARQFRSEMRKLSPG